VGPLRHGRHGRTEGAGGEKDGGRGTDKEIPPPHIAPIFKMFNLYEHPKSPKVKTRHIGYFLGTSG